MNDIPSTLLGTLVVKAGLATAEQVDECVRVQQLRRTEGGPALRLGEIMVDKGFLSREQLNSVLRGDFAERGRRFGELCVRMGFLTGEQVRDALAEQDRLRGVGTVRRLGEILVKKSRLKSYQIPAVLGVQGYEVAECTKCRLTFNVDVKSPATGFKCPRCGRSLISVTAYDEAALEELESRRSKTPAARAPAAARGSRPQPAGTTERITVPLEIVPAPAVRAAEDKLKNAERARDEAVKYSERLRTELDELEQLRGDAAAERDTLRTRLEEVERELETARTALEQRQSEAGRVQNESVALKAEIEVWEDLLAAERTLVAERTEGLQKADEARQAAEEEVEILRARLEEAERARAEAASELVTLKLDLDQRDAELAELKAEARRRRYEARHTTSRLEQAQRTSEVMRYNLELKDEFIKQLTAEAGEHEKRPDE